MMSAHLHILLITTVIFSPIYLISFLRFKTQFLTKLKIFLLRLKSTRLVRDADLSKPATFQFFGTFLSPLSWMRQNIVSILYFLPLAVLILLLRLEFLLSVVQLIQLIKELNDHNWMPHPANENPLVLSIIGDDGFDEIYFNFPWTITLNNESITVKITYIKWTFEYDFWIRVKRRKT